LISTQISGDDVTGAIVLIAALLKAACSQRIFLFGWIDCVKLFKVRSKFGGSVCFITYRRLWWIEISTQSDFGGALSQLTFVLPISLFDSHEDYNHPYAGIQVLEEKNDLGGCSENEGIESVT